MERITSPQTGDSCIHVKHESGLEIYISEMPGFSSVEALFGTKYGSINTMFKQRDDEEYTVVPEGIAHFLEHKLFENEDCDVFALYAKTGANGNAFTSFDKTAYLFSCTKNYQASLKILLDFVQAPYFTQETVDKEQGIIGQEIQMTNDEPDWRVLFNMLGAMYHDHPVKIDIAGTKESIAKIDADLLYKCYYTFYNLNNMVLSVAGNVKAEEVLAICDECLKPCEDKGLETVFPDEPETVVKNEVYEQLPVGTPMFNLGYKCDDCYGTERLVKEVTGSIAISVLTDDASDFYKKLLTEETINDSLDGQVFCGDGYFSVIFEGESKKPKKLREELFAEIERIGREGIDEKVFERIRRSTYGSMIRMTNSVEAVAMSALNLAMQGVGPYDEIKILSELKSSDVVQFIRDSLIPDKSVLSVIDVPGGNAFESGVE
ncbi:MAG: insulinase family protein [Ruminococcus sp.]|nr:insulinase family protein [Ruminococcus sp.]